MTSAVQTANPRPSGSHSHTSGWHWLRYFSTRPLVLVCGLAVCVILVVQVWLVWSDTGLNEEMTLTSGFIGGAALAYPISAGLGAWIGYREHKFVLRDWHATGTRRSHLGRATVVGGATFALGAGVLAAGLIVAVAMTVLPHRVGMIGTDVVVSTLSMITVWVPLGYIIARHLRYALVVPAVALLGWLLPALFGTGHGTPAAMLLPAVAPGGDVFPTWNGPILWWQVGWFGGLTAVLFAVVLWRWPARMPIALAAGGLIVAISGVSAIALLDFDRHQTVVHNGETVAQSVCEGNSPQLCLHPAFEGLRPEVHATFQELMMKVQGTPAYASVLEHRPRGLGQEPTEGAVAIHLDYALPGDSVLARHEYVESLLDWEACYVDFDPTNQTWATLVFQWLTDELEHPRDEVGLDPTTTQAEWQEVRGNFLALTPEARTAWFATHFETFRYCELTASDFPR